MRKEKGNAGEKGNGSRSGRETEHHQLDQRDDWGGTCMVDGLAAAGTGSAHRTGRGHFDGVA